MTSSADPVQTVEWRCLKCRNIPWDCEQWVLNPQNGVSVLDFGLELDHHDSPIALEESAATGCGLCRNLRARVLHNLSSVDDLPTGQFKLQFLMDSHVSFQIDNNFDLGFYDFLERSQSPTSLDRFSPLQTASSSSPKSFSSRTADDDLKCLVRNLITPWFNDCTNNHDYCKSRREMDRPRAIPTRLIDVGENQGTKARLIISQQELHGTQEIGYLILSYCWGKSNNPAKTTRANLAARQKHIDESGLPKTIQDAVTLTRLLGFRYLWVDAICIIQSHSGDDYQGDFRAEAPKIGAYYTNAFCLISALNASDSSTGLFTERPAHRYETTSSVIGFDKRTNEYVYLPRPRRTLSHEFHSAPLLKRGWCFQERLLSSRFLHWSRNGLFWQCLEVERPRSEFPDKVDEDEFDTRISNTGIFHGLISHGGHGWIRYVREYSSMAFSFQTDRLIAIDGLGTRLASLREDDYFAGIFRNHLSRGLTWQSDPEDINRRKLDIFPSWSWASCHSESYGVTVSDDDKTPHECANFCAFPTIRDPLDFKEPWKRMLRLNAPLLKFKPGQYQMVDKVGYSFEIAETEFYAYFTYDTAELDELEFNCQGDIYILMLLLGTVQKGILLRSKQGMYERVGYISLSHWSGPRGFGDPSFWTKFRVDVDLI